jgi:excisionase family DNA binding protein
MSKVELTCPEILSAEDVATILRLPLKTVRARLHDKSLKGTKIGKHWRIHKKDLERFLS